MSVIAAARQANPDLNDYTDQEILEGLAKANQFKPGSKQYKELESVLLGYDRSAAGAVKDAGVALAQGVTNIGKMAGTIGGMALESTSMRTNPYDNPVTNKFAEWTDDLDEYKTQGLKNREAGAANKVDIAQRTATAEGAGKWGRIGASAKAQLGAYADSPSLAAQDVVTNAPQLAVSGGIGRGLQMGTTALGATAKVAARAGLAGGIGSGALMQGADIGADTYRRAIQAGASQDEATSLANEAAMKAGAATLALAALPGATSIERSMLRPVAGAARGGLGKVGSVVKSTLGEAASEAVEEGYGKFASNQAIRELNPNQDLVEGVGQAGVQGAVASGPMGALAGLHHSNRGAAPRTETGEIDLIGSARVPNELDTPTYQRRGLDPLNERSSPWSPTPPAAPAAAPTSNGTIMTVDSAGTVLPGQTAERLAETERMRKFQEGIPTLTDVLAPADGIPVLNEEIPTLTDVLAPADGIPVLTDQVDTAERPTRGRVLSALNAASNEVKTNALKKDGTVSNTKGAAPLRAVLEAQDPLAEIRNQHKDGNGNTDELLDAWHKQLTGKTVFEAKAPALNSAGFVAEPIAQVQAQVAAVRDGRKDVAVLGQEEAKQVDTKGLVSGIATGPDGASAVVVAADQAKVDAAVARAKEVGLKQAMGEALGVANPTATTDVNPDAQVLQQVDNATGQVIGEEVVTPEDAPNVKPIPGTTPRVAPVDEVLAARGDGNGLATDDQGGGPVAGGSPSVPVGNQRSDAGPVEGAGTGERNGQPVAAAPDTAPGADTPSADKPADAKPPLKKKNRFGKKTDDELVDLAETTKDDAEMSDARYELYRRWANGSETAENYLTDKANKSNLSKAEEKEFKERLDNESRAKGIKKGQKLGQKFGVDEGNVKMATESWSNPDNEIDKVDLAAVKDLTTGPQLAKWLAENATDPWHKEVIARIMPFLTDNVLIKYVTAGDSVPARVANNLSGDAHALAYNLGNGTFMLYYHTGKSFNESILVHELVHAATMAALSGDKNIPLRNEMRRLLIEVKKTFKDVAGRGVIDPGQRDMAAFFDAVLIDENELLAYAFSSPSMRKWMQNMNAKGQFIPNTKTADYLRNKAERRMPGVPPLTTWQWFTDIIRKMLGFTPVNQKRLDEMLQDREDKIAMFIKEGQDTSLYNELDAFLDKALEAQAGDTTQSAPSQAAGAGSVVKGIGDAAREVAAQTKALTRGQEISSKLLSLMTLRQIDEQFGDKLPALRDWVRAIMERSSNANKLAAEADRVALQWEKSVKNADERSALANVLLSASVEELELDNTTAKYLATLTEKQRALHTQLRSKLEAMSPEAQKTRKQALEILRRQWEYTRSSLESFINHTVADPALRNQRLEELKTELGRNRGDYFPLSRFGDRVVVGKAAAADGRDVISFHESLVSEEAEVARLRAQGLKPNQITRTIRTVRNERDRATTGFMGSLHQAIDSSEADSSTKDSLHEALQQLYLKSMPELSGAKHMIRREAVEGYSKDALRAFADAVTRGSRYASHLEFGPQVQAAMEAAESQSRSSDKRTAAVIIGTKEGQRDRVMVTPTGTERLNAVNQMTADGYTVKFMNAAPETAKDVITRNLEASEAEINAYVAQVTEVAGRANEQVQDMRAAKALYNHMVTLQKSEGNQDASALVDAMGQAGYVWYLGFSPAFWLMNTLQNPMIGMPHLGAKFGLAKSSAEWMGAAKWFATVRMGKAFSDRKTPFSVEWLKEAVDSGKVKGISKDEIRMLQTLEDRQVLDFTQAMDLSRIGQASSDTRYKFMRLAAAGAHHTEVFNRVTFALAAYRLAKKADGAVTHETATRSAENDTAAVHFDYSYANKPELMRGRKTRLLFMFQQYRQHMLYWWANNIKDAIKGEAPADRTRARKAALLMGTTQLVFAGTLGLPFVGAVATLANMLGHDDDDGVPFDFNRWVTEAAVDITGSTKAGEVLSKGIFAALGMNISKRIGQADILPFLNEGSSKFEKNGDDKMRAYIFDLLGPLGSIALNGARSLEAFQRGDVSAGIAAATPKFASDLVKAWELESEGMTDKKGQTLATAEAFDGADIFMQAAGVSPTEVSNRKADKQRVSQTDIAYREKTRQITGRFVEAWSRSDREGMAEVLEEVKAFNAKLVSKGLATKEFTIDGNQLVSAVKERQRRAMLLALTGGTAETKRQLMVATREQGLYNPVTRESIQANSATGVTLPQGD